MEGFIKHAEKKTEERKNTYEARALELLELLDLSESDLKDADVLDVGAGNGALVKYLREKSINATALDIDHPFIGHTWSYGMHGAELDQLREEAQELVENEDPRLEQINKEYEIGGSYLIGDAYNLDIEDESYDYVTATHTLPVMGTPTEEEMKQVISEYRRVLKSGGEMRIAIRGLDYTDESTPAGLSIDKLIRLYPEAEIRVMQTVEEDMPATAVFIMKKDEHK